MDAEKRDEIQSLTEDLVEGGLKDESDLVVWMLSELERLENNSSQPVKLSKCPACAHYSLAGFKHCPLCGARKGEA